MLKKHTNLLSKNNKITNQLWLLLTGFIMLGLLLSGCSLSESTNQNQPPPLETDEITNITPTNTVVVVSSPTVPPSVSEIIASPTEETLMAAVVESETVQLFAMPNEDSDIINVLGTGSSLAVLNRTIEGDWLKVQNIQGLSGWIKTDSVKVFMPVFDIPIVQNTPQPPPTATVAATPTATPTTIKTNTPVPRSNSSSQPQAPTKTPYQSSSQSSSQASNLLLGPVLLEPEDGATFNTPSIPVISWQSLKTTLAEDELYFITIIFQHQGETWTDEAWTQETTWSFEKHYYLLDISSDGRFVWSVKLLRKTGEDEKGIPTGLDLSHSSEERVLFWRIPKPSSPDSIKTSPVNKR